MKYKHVVPGIFLQRPNRFIAHVLINGQEEICHVANTGRCRELLVPGCTVYCSVSENPRRKTKCDRITVEKKTERTFLVNMDSLAPNAAAKEWLVSGASPFGKICYIKPEFRYGISRFDFYLECEDDPKTKLHKIFLEVKGVTLEDNGTVLFPDAPTERGVKHVRELIRCHEEGYDACILFVVQMEHALYFTPNRKMHPQFADALCDAQNAGVLLLAYTCRVTPDEIELNKSIPVTF